LRECDECDNNGFVIRFRTIWTLALLAALSVALAPQSLAAWVCEGRTCGTTPLFCCCSAPGNAGDANCNTSVNPTPGAGCPSGCECVLTVTNADTTAPPPLAGQLTAPDLALVSAVFSAYPAAAPAEEMPHVGETRGPPQRLLCLAAPVLRGPPSLSVPHTGV
jgi:hypothetical protein